jgi:hypothetical protein
MTGRVSILALLAHGCVVFDPPIAATPDGGSDGGAPARDSGGPDAGGTDAGYDAFVADDDAGVGILRRPPLASCGFAAATVSGTVTDGTLNEISGIAASRRNPRIVWMVEDSGSAAVVHAVNDEARLVATFGVGGAALDYEDMAIGPGPMAGVDYLYIADIGDNDGSRSSIVIYRAPEPEVGWDQPFVTSALERVEPLPMTYPPGDIDNAEAIFVDPDTADLYLITRNGFTKPNTIFRLTAPQTPAVTRTLERLGMIYAGDGTDIAVSSAAISRDGRHIAIRALRAINFWNRPAGMSIVETILRTTPCDASLGEEEKGESITFAPAGDGYFTISEGLSQPLHFVATE